MVLIKMFTNPGLSDQNRSKVEFTFQSLDIPESDWMVCQFFVMADLNLITTNYTVKPSLNNFLTYILYF